MILNSCKVLKRSSANNDETKEDFMSTFPDALLTQILSLLSDADGCRTSILSKRWKHLWMFHVIIRSYPTIEQANEYYDLVDKTLAIRNGMPIQRFILDCKADCDLKRVYDWLRIVAQCGLQILVLKFGRDWNNWNPPILVSRWGFFKTCNTLVELTLEGGFELDVHKEKVLFPSMKKISLEGIQYSGDASFENIIHGCPVLEELCFTRHADELRRVNVSSTSLKRLRIHADATSLVYWECKVTIDAPNLEYLYIMDEVQSDYSFTVKPSSLVEAYIDADTNNADQIVTKIAAAKVLTLKIRTIRAFDAADEVYEFDEFDEIYDQFDEFDENNEVNDLNVRIFPNLVKLVTDILDIRDWRLLVILLHNMPKLEYITFLNEHPPVYVNWNPLHERACMHFRMKEIVLFSRESVTEEEFALVECLLKHSSNLEKLTINVRENDHDRREKLLNLFRGSSRCQIEFVSSL